MTISNYNAKTVPDQIIIKFWGTTPDNPGESSAIIITTYTNTSNGYVIDQDTQFAIITVVDVCRLYLTKHHLKSTVWRFLLNTLAQPLK